MPDKLKPCPFCGGSRAIVEKSEGWGCQTQPYQIRCIGEIGRGCNAIGPINHIKQDAIKAWNTRKR